ncbi:coiled-coil domain-containing protein 153 isoform X2 [Pleuronectes platessa]|uniref:coiled-coil domain-containing protein 153 isoform X2 n=1 Tax=Pleuronectes platessa TaxID=8262 RepID=UPI00232A48DB|nr:coiled-coil domain-containing protein 153 isoform X2 [Pleuronectes platessa]
MSPKKKTKKIPKKKQDRSENDLEAKYRRSVLDVAILQDHIAVQCESVRTVQSDRIDLRRRARDMDQKLQHERQDHRDVNSTLCQEELRKEKREREQMEQEKDATIAQLQHKLDNMETDYEKILHDTLDSLTSQLSAARQRQEDTGTTFHQNYQGLLSEFGLNALDI